MSDGADDGGVHALSIVQVALWLEVMMVPYFKLSLEAFHDHSRFVM